MKRLFLLAWGAALLASAACAGDPREAPASAGAAVPGNLFQNPGFEEGPGPWYSLQTQAWGPPFRLADTVAHSGQNSAYLEMRAGSQDPAVRIYGVAQEVSPREFPEVLSGYYRVEAWNRGAPKQYLQFVVIVWGAETGPPDTPNYQIRYLLGGIDREPFRIGNARYVFINKEEPQTGRWIYFERNIRED